MSNAETGSLRVDIVSDVVCPWCIVGYRQLMQAAGATGTELEIHWHPFELNPEMEPEGENLRDHIMRKYGSSAADSAAARDRLSDLGKGLGIDFNFSDDSRIYNTFQAHQLIGWCTQQGKGPDMKQALFKAYFTDGKDVSDVEVLLEAAAGIGVDAEAARAALESGELAPQTRQHEAFWTGQGISGVPAMVFDRQHLVTGAQGAENYGRILEHLKAAAAAE